MGFNCKVVYCYGFKCRTRYRANFKKVDFVLEIGVRLLLKRKKGRKCSKH